MCKLLKLLIIIQTCFTILLRERIELKEDDAAKKAAEEEKKKEAERLAELEALNKGMKCSVDTGHMGELFEEGTKRVDQLEKVETDLETGMNLMEDALSSKSVKGITSFVDIADPEEELKKIEEMKKNKSLQSKMGSHEVIIGDQSAPIIIIEATNLDPLEEVEVEKLLQCSAKV